MVTRRRGEKKPVEIDWPWALLLIPVMAVVAGLSVPYALIAGRILRRKELAFRIRMQAARRIMAWPDFVQAMNESRGTLIRELYSLKGPDRWWWTAEDVYAESPHPSVDWLTMRMDNAFPEFSQWCQHRYTGAEAGKALLVDTDSVSESEIKSFQSRLKLESGDVRWIEVAPPKRR